MGRPTGTWIFWLLYPLPSLAQLLLSQDITIMAMVVMDMEVMVIMATMARERLSQLLLPKLMLNQDITIMAMVVMAMEVMVIIATTARERLSQLLLLKLKLMLSQDIIIMVTLMAM